MISPLQGIADVVMLAIQEALGQVGLGIDVDQQGLFADLDHKKAKFPVGMVAEGLNLLGTNFQAEMVNNMVYEYSKPDIIFRKNTSDSKKGSVLFVPGAFTGSWIWNKGFIPAFAQAGFDVYAMTFRSHNMPAHRQLTLSMDDYYHDLCLAIDSIPEKPIVIGFSLGGLFVYKYLLDHELPACLLLSPVPPYGSRKSFTTYFFSEPLSALKLVSLSLFPELCFWGDPPAGILSAKVDSISRQSVIDQLRSEPITILMQSGFSNLPVRRIDRTPLKLIGSTGDLVIPYHEVRRTAELIGAEVDIYPGFSHCLMVEPGADQVIGDMLDWIDVQILAKSTESAD